MSYKEFLIVLADKLQIHARDWDYELRDQGRRARPGHRTEQADIDDED